MDYSGSYQRYLNRLTEDRLSKLEEKIFPSKRTPANLPQQLLLLDQLGILDILRMNFKSNIQTASFLSILLNADQHNIRKALSNDSPLKTAVNYAFLKKIYEDHDLTELSLKADLEYNKLADEQPKIKLK